MDIDLTVTVPQFDDNGWDYEQSVSKCRNLYAVVRHGGTKLVLELLHAHEMLVKKEVPGKTWGRYCEEIGVSSQTVINWFNKHQLSYTQISGPKEEPKNLGSDNPLKKQTKPGTKLQLKEVIQEIKAGNVSDDDEKTIGDTLADNIKTGKSAKRVGTRISTAIKHIDKQKEPKINLKPIDNFYRLKNHIRSSIDGLTLWADKTMKPETQDEAECAKVIMASAANNIIQYARLGIDVQGIYSTFIEGKEKKNARENKEYIELEKVDR